MSRPKKQRRGFSPMRDLPGVLWLLAVLVVTLVHPFVPAPRWLMIHLLLLGAVTHSILVWSRHFAETLLHSASTAKDLRRHTTRLALLNAGVLVVVAGVVGAWWPVTAVGATAVSAAAVWHGAALLGQLRRALPSRFGATVRYYVTAAALLPLGALLGVLMARGLDETWHVRVMLAHAAVNLLGWMGLTVLGTLVTLWPTMLRTRIADGTERAARRALPTLVVGVLLTAGASLAGLLPLVPVGLVVYLAGMVLLAVPFVDATRRKLPAAFPTWSVATGVTWLAGTLVYLVVTLSTASTWQVAHDRIGWITPALAAGFGAQVLLGALSYLVPVSLGGGPTPARAANTVFDRGGALRVVVTNAGLLVCFLPVPSIVRVIASALVLVALGSFVPLLFLAIRASRKARTAAPPVVPASQRRGPAPVAAERPRGQVTGLAAAGLAAVVLAVAAGVALDPSALTGAVATESASAGVAGTGETTHVVVEAKNMRFTPATVKVPVGNRLVIDLRNTDASDVHDLVLESGQDSGRLAPGDSARLTVPVVGRDVDGWCSVVGHRQMGMVLSIQVTGTPPAGSGTQDSPADGHAGHQHGPGASTGTPNESAPSGHTQGSTGTPATGLDFMAEPGPGFTARDASLPPLEDGTVHRRTFTVSEVEREVAPGYSQKLWTYNGGAPGPVLHGRVGDRFVITLVNDGSIGHSVDFHAGALAPDEPMRTIKPGESLVYRFTATMAGIWMYHCSTMPMSAHIANGMFGAVIIDPPDLPRVDRSYVLAQSELYLGPRGGVVDVAKLQAERPDAVVFNGYANQYDHAPLRARVGERIRIWVLDAGPNRPSSFHVVGGQFDTVFSEGAYLLRRGNAQHGGAQVLNLGPAQGGFVELTFPEPGHYPFVSHLMVDAERGAHGVFEVTD